MVDNVKTVAPWLTYDKVMGFYRTQAKKRSINAELDALVVRVDAIEAAQNVEAIIQITNPLEPPIEIDAVRNLGGRPKGTTDKKRKISEANLVATVNEIALEYNNALQHNKRQKRRMKRGSLTSLIARIKAKNNVGADVIIAEETIRQRIKRDAVFTNGGRGHDSPLLPLEPTIVKIIIQMSRIRQCVTPSQGLKLVNSMILGTPVQDNLVRFKERMCSNSDGTVGTSYWRGFMQRNGHKLVSKRGQKYELDRAAWSTYHNFGQMYDQVGEEMIDAKVARKIDQTWMDIAGNVVHEKDSFGCKVNMEITRPDICFTMDEVGGNISQKGDGAMGGELFLCEKGKTPQQKISTKDKHYTVLGLTNLEGKAVMCVVIFSGTKRAALTETGLDLSADVIGNMDDRNFFENNNGTGKRFPGGPSCEYKGKTVPCLSRWSEKGGITTHILVDILSALDSLLIFDINRRNGIKPFLLVDGHRSRFELPFLEYICSPLHEWAVVIGVPYGTALWQVGDAPEQNGCFNMASVDIKKSIVERKEEMLYPSPTIEAYDIMNIVSYAWSKSFLVENSNRTAISERGWNPYNRNLMTYPIIRASITKEEAENELLDTSKIVLPIQKRVEITDLIDTSTQVIDPRYASKPVPDVKKVANFSQGTASFCLDKIVMQQDLNEARSRIKRNREEGKSLVEKIRDMKGFTAGRLFHAKSSRVGQTILQVYKENIAVQEEAVNVRANNAAITYRAAKDTAEAILATGILISNMNNNQLKTILLPLKTKDDGAMPTRKKDMIAAYDRWKNRAPPIFTIVVREEVQAQANELVLMRGELEANEVDLDNEELD